MSGTESTARKKTRRKQYMVQQRLQLAITLPFAIVLGAIVLMHVIEFLILANRGVILGLSDPDTGRAILLINGAYFLVSTAICVVAGVILTNRIAGPAMVIERGLNGILEGDMDRRLALRKGDHLQELAEAAQRVRDHIAVRDRKIADLEACLKEGDLDAARELVNQLRRRDDAQAETTADTPVVPA